MLPLSPDPLFGKLLLEEGKDKSVYIGKTTWNSGSRRGIRGEQTPNFSASLVKWCDMIYEAGEVKDKLPCRHCWAIWETPGKRLCGRKNWAQEGRSDPFPDVIFLYYTQHHLMELTGHTTTLPTVGRSCATDTGTWRAAPGGPESSWENTTAKAALHRHHQTGSGPSLPWPCTRDSTASHRGRKADPGEMEITPAQITPSWIVHGPSDTIKVRSTAGSWPNSLTPFSHWEGRGSAAKRCYSVFEGNTQPETYYFSFYKRANWP